MTRLIRRSRGANGAKPFDKRISPGGAVQPFYPNQLGSLAFWFRYGVGITVTGAGVSTWADQSGNSRDLLQGTDTNRPPLQSDGSILFDGVDNFLKCGTFTLNQPNTVIILCKQITWTSVDYIIDGHTDNTLGLFQQTATPRLTMNAGATAPTTLALALDTYGAIGCVFNGASSLLQVNAGAAATGDAGAGNAAGLTLGAHGGGADGYANIQVKELFGYSVALSQADLNRALAYCVRLGL